MELEQLRHFAEVVECESLTRAASVLGVSQPLLSRQIRRLETDMQTVLLVRTGRGVKPTDAGKRLAVAARDIFAQLDVVRNGGCESDQELRGRVVVGLPPSLGRAVTVPFIRAFTARFPNAQAVIVEGLSRTLYDGILDDRIDLALLHDQKPSPSVEIELITMDPLYLISARAEPATPAPSIPFETVLELPLIFPNLPNPIRRTVERAATERGASLNIKYEIDGVDAILQLVCEGFGTTIMANTIIARTRYADQLSVQRIVSPSLRTAISLAKSVRSREVTLNERAAALMREVLGEMLVEGDEESVFLE